MPMEDDDTGNEPCRAPHRLPWECGKADVCGRRCLWNDRVPAEASRSDTTCVPGRLTNDPIGAKGDE